MSKDLNDWPKQPEVPYDHPDHSRLWREYEIEAAAYVESLQQHSQIKHLPPNKLAIKIPEDANHLWIDDSDTTLVFWYKCNGFDDIAWVNLPPGTYRLVGMKNTMTEEGAAELVEYFTDYEAMKSGYRTYKSWAHEYDLLPTALESFATYCAFHGLEGNWAFLIKSRI